MPLRVVLDTGVVLSAMLFSGGRLSWLRLAWRDGSVVPLITKATAEELVRVLAYPKFALSQGDREELLGDFLPYAEVAPEPAVGDAGPRCRDPHDQKFIDLAIAAHADALVSGDDDLLSLAATSPVPILSAAAFRLKLSGVDRDHRRSPIRA